METNPATTGKISLKFGLILGAIGVVFGLMLYSMDAHTTQSPGMQILNIVISLSVIVWAIISFKKANGGQLSVGQAVKIGAGTALIGAIISVLYTLLLSNVIDPDFTTKVMENRMAQAVAEGNIEASQVPQSIEMGKKFFWVGYPVILIISIVFGLVVGLIGGLIFKSSDGGSIKSA